MALSRGSLIALSLSGALVVALPAEAVAAKQRAERFKGTCAMSGVIRHDPPMTTTPKETTVRGGFSGTCSGALRDRKGRMRQLDQAPATYDGRGTGELSCLGGVAEGTGKLGFGRGRVIEFRLTERRGPGTATVTLRGKAGGTGTVAGTVSRDEDLDELNQRCMGSGVRLLRGDLRLVSPGMSG